MPECERPNVLLRMTGEAGDRFGMCTEFLLSRLPPGVALP